MDRWHKGASCCPVSRDKGGGVSQEEVSGGFLGIRGEEGREKGGWHCKEQLVLNPVTVPV